jgi:short-chain Z-isoprenyl diphosphate synthase
VDGLSEPGALGRGAPIAVPDASALASTRRTGGARAALERTVAWLAGCTRYARAPLYRVYTGRLRSEVRMRPRPQHVAVILDGNRRWAQLAGLSDPGAGHRRGADTLAQLIGWCGTLDIGELTVWALSRENLTREERERSALIEVLAEELTTLPERALRRGAAIRVRVFGRLDSLPDPLARAAAAVQERTSASDGLHLNVALGYSGRDELVDAARAMVAALVADGVPASELASRVDAESLSRHLYTAGHSDPELIIRTSGEMRLSGFLPWQSSHSEFYFTDVYWPAFRELDFLRAVRTFQQRERRFGR